jgi:hypothetical protein
MEPKDISGNDHDEISHLTEYGTTDVVTANATSPKRTISSSYAACHKDQHGNTSVTSPYRNQGSIILLENTSDSVSLPLVASPAKSTINSSSFSVVGAQISQLHQPDPFISWSPASHASAIHAGSPLTYKEAYLVHHFATHLGQWLDCTDASRQFVRKVPILVKQSPILLHAVLSYAARHVGDAEMAEQAHERCVELLIPFLSSETVADDDILLCTIVILRVFEQLNGEPENFSSHHEMPGLIPWG